MTKKISIGFALLFCCTLWAADFRPLDVKTGQWEYTLTGQMTGLPPIPEEVLKRLTPEQRAKMEAVRGGSPKTTVSKNCVTKDKLDQAFNMGDEAMKSCTRTLITSSGSRQEVHINCNRDGVKTTGVVKVEAVNPENVKGTMQMTMVNPDHTMNMNYSFAAKWTGPACTEKP